MIDRQYFDRVFLEAVDQLRKVAPKDTGNLAYNAIKYNWVGEKEFVIFVDVGNVQQTRRVNGIAPYMPFTNEKWISPNWNEKTNPNENWWNEAMEMVIYFIAKRLGGSLQ